MMRISSQNAHQLITSRLSSEEIEIESDLLCGNYDIFGIGSVLNCQYKCYTKYDYDLIMVMFEISAQL